MLREKHFEDIICKYPELIEENLKFKGRQIRVHGKIMDILFEDKFGQKLIVELKAGSIDRKHIGQVMEYEGGILNAKEPTARIMLVGNRVPPNLRKALDYHGIECKEIGLAQLREFLGKLDDSVSLGFLDEQEEIIDMDEKCNDSASSMVAPFSRDSLKMKEGRRQRKQDPWEHKVVQFLNGKLNSDMATEEKEQKIKVIFPRKSGHNEELVLV
jgi:predicted RecB family endonuclease